jgi:hypothetical protein
VCHTKALRVDPKLHINTGEIDHFEIYSFAGAITQQLNLWKDGKVDFRKNIDKYHAYITPEYRAYLLARTSTKIIEYIFFSLAFINLSVSINSSLVSILSP